jgi:uncharacterized membrane-anchored protein
VWYWLAVMLVSVFGTLVTDNLTDNLGVPLEVSTAIFAVLLGVTFIAWYRVEGTLSVHSIDTRRREGFYWLAILLTFALGTATGDLMAEVLGLGYLVSGLLVAGLITLASLGWRLGLHPVLAFWIVYILTRPLGASIGDFLSQPTDQGGVGLGATTTSLAFTVGIIVIVAYLSVSKVDVITEPARAEAPTRGGLWQTVAVVAVLLVAGGTGYQLRTAALRDGAPEQTTAQSSPGTQPNSTESGVNAGAAPGAGAGAAAASPLGDLSAFRGITQDTLALLNAGEQSGATARVDDLETSWDNAEARLKPRDKAAWTTIDGKIDTVLRELRAANPNPDTERAALTDLLPVLS